MQLLREHSGVPQCVALGTDAHGGGGGALSKGLEVTVVRFHGLGKWHVSGAEAASDTGIILSCSKLSLPTFSDAIFPGSPFSGSSLCLAPVKVRPGLLGDTLVLSIHTFSQGAVVHAIMSASLRGRLRTPGSPSQLRPL